MKTHHRTGSVGSTASRSPVLTRGGICVPPTVIYSPYRVSGSTLTAVGRSQLLARWPGTFSRILSGIQRAAHTVLGVYLKRTCSRVTSAFSALGVLNDYALYKSTHSLTYSRQNGNLAIPSREGEVSEGEVSYALAIYVRRCLRVTPYTAATSVMFFTQTPSPPAALTICCVYTAAANHRYLQQPLVTNGLPSCMRVSVAYPLHTWRH